MHLVDVSGASGRDPVRGLRHDRRRAAAVRCRRWPRSRRSWPPTRWTRVDDPSRVDALETPRTRARTCRSSESPAVTGEGSTTCSRRCGVRLPRRPRTCPPRLRMTDDCSRRRPRATHERRAVSASSAARSIRFTSVISTRPTRRAPRWRSMTSCSIPVARSAAPAASTRAPRRSIASRWSRWRSTDRRTSACPTWSCVRQGTSYTADTLADAARRRAGARRSFSSFSAPMRLQKLPRGTNTPPSSTRRNFVVIARPGTTIDAAIARTPALRSRTCAHAVTATAHRDSTRFSSWTQHTRDVSSTHDSRSGSRAGQPIDDLVPPAVARHILRSTILYGAVDDLHGEDERTRKKAVGLRSTGRQRRRSFPKAVAGAVHAARDKKAIDVVVLDLRKAGGFTDYFVICTGANPRQINAIADGGARDAERATSASGRMLAEGVEKSRMDPARLLQLRRARLQPRVPRLLRARAALGQRRAARVLRRGVDALLAATLAPSCAACNRRPWTAATYGCVCPACWAAVIPTHRTFAASHAWTTARTSRSGDVRGQIRRRAARHHPRVQVRRPPFAGVVRWAACCAMQAPRSLTAAMYVVPVPLHPWRRLQRGFNQARRPRDASRIVPSLHALWRSHADRVADGTACGRAPHATSAARSCRSPCRAHRGSRRSSSRSTTCGRPARRWTSARRCCSPPARARFAALTRSRSRTASSATARDRRPPAITSGSRGPRRGAPIRRRPPGGR